MEDFVISRHVLTIIVIVKALSTEAKTIRETKIGKDKNLKHNNYAPKRKLMRIVTTRM